jgi:long-subunit acyl-CoA synthetase (AMP-forming)
MATLQTSFHGLAGNVAVIIPSKSNPLTVTYEGLRSECDSFQRKLAAIGVGHASPVSIALINSYEFIVSFEATSWQRGIAAPLNPAYKQDEFEFYIEDIKSALVLVPQGAYQANAPAVRAAKKFNAAVAECYWDEAKKEVALDVKDLGQLKGKGKQELLRAQADDVALVLHTR